MSLYDDLLDTLEDMYRTGNPLQRGIAAVGRGALELNPMSRMPGALGIFSLPGGSSNWNRGATARRDIRPPRPSPGFGINRGKVGSNSFNDPLSELLTMLQQPVGVNEEDLMSQVRAQFDPIYDERIRSAESRTNRGRGEVEDMYSALAADYERLAPEQAAQAEAAQAEIENLYGQLRSNIQGNYSRVSEEQADLFKQLGIEAAAPEVMADQSQSTLDAMNSAAELQAVNEQRYQDIANIDESYYREGSPLASLTGTNISKDMLFDLNELVQGLEAERTTGIQQAYTQLLGQAQDRASQMQGRNTEMLFNILMQQSEAQNQPQQPLDANSFIGSLPPQLQATVGQAFTSLQRSQEAVTGRQELTQSPTPGTFVPVTPEWYFAQVDEMAQQGMIDEQTRQALLMYLQLRFQG